jgi:cytochrome P450
MWYAFPARTPGTTGLPAPPPLSCPAGTRFLPWLSGLESVWISHPSFHVLDAIVPRSTERDADRGPIPSWVEVRSIRTIPGPTEGEPIATAAAVPSPPASFLGQHLMAFRRDPPTYVLEAARTYGDVVRLRLGPHDVFLMSHPDFVREVLITQRDRFTRSPEYRMMREIVPEGLLTATGETHRRHRKLMLPAFHYGRIASYVDIMARHTDEHQRGWVEGQEVDISGEMMRLAFQIVGDALFGEDLEDESHGVERAMKSLLETYFRFFNPILYHTRWLPTPATLRYQWARRRVFGTVNRMIASHRADGTDRGDLLSMLLLAQHEDDRTHLTDEQVRDQCLTLLIAGHETAATALSWTWHLLGQHPHVEERLHREVDQVLGGRRPRLDDLDALPYTQQVVSEAMRLYPPVWVVGRTAAEDVEIGGHAIPAGATVYLSQYVLHRDARFFEDPERFDPDRWRPERKKDLSKFAYFPFGVGPRICIGKQFAWMETVVVLALLASRWRAVPVEDHEVRPIARLTLRPADGVRMRLYRRDGGHAAPTPTASSSDGRRDP